MVEHPSSHTPVHYDNCADLVAEVEDWQGHPPEVLQSMLGHLGQLRAQGLDVIED